MEEIVASSHPSLGDAGQQLLQDLLFRYSHVFPAPGEPVTSWTTAVNMISVRRMPARFGAAHDGWPPPASDRNRHVCRKCCTGGKLTLVIAPEPGFGDQERRVNALLCRLSRTERTNDEGRLSLAPDR